MGPPFELQRAPVISRYQDENEEAKLNGGKTNPKFLEVMRIDDQLAVNIGTERELDELRGKSVFLQRKGRGSSKKDCRNVVAIDS